MEQLRSPQIEVETIWRTILVTDARDSSKAYFSERAVEALVRIERDRALFAQIAAQHGGEEARDRGDGSMFAFCDPTEAMRAAIRMQEEVAAYNATLPDDVLHLHHRMGLHMGQIKLAKTRLPGEETIRRKLSGDIVVTASRLEGICHPGEVCLSNEVHRVVKEAVKGEFRYLDATLKGFDRPMRCWSTRMDPSWDRPLTAEEETAKQKREEERRLRNRWEREQREKYLRFLAVRGAAWFAAASLVFAGFRIIQAADNFDSRIARAWSAFLGPTEHVYVAKAAPHPPTTQDVHRANPRRSRRRSIVRMAPKPTSRSARKPARSEVASALRRALNEGALSTVSITLDNMGFAGPRYIKVVDDVERVRAAQEWLSDRLDLAGDDESQAVVLDRPVAGMTVLTRADEIGIRGLDGDGRVQQVPYSRLTARDFETILRDADKEADKGDPVPEKPELCAKSLASLRNPIL